MKKIFLTLKYILIFASYFIANIITSALLFTRYPILSVGMEIIYLIILCLLLKDVLIKEWHIFKKDIDGNLTIAVRFWMLGIIAMTVSNLLIGTFVPAVETTNETAVRSLISAIPITMFFSVIIMAPLTEELIFRGVLKQLFKTTWLFILISSLLFGSAHVITGMSSWYDLLLIIPYGFMGLALALSYVKSKNIYTPIFLHLIHNAITFGLFMLLSK